MPVVFQRHVSITAEACQDVRFNQRRRFRLNAPVQAVTFSYLASFHFFEQLDIRVKLVRYVSVSLERLDGTAIGEPGQQARIP